MTPVQRKVLPNGSTRVGSKELQGGSIGRRSSHNNRVLESTCLLKLLHNLRNSRPLLPDSNVHTVQLLGLALRLLVQLALRDKRVNSNRRLSRLTVANDQLTLPTPNGNKRINRLDPSLHRLGHRLTRDNPGSLDLNTPPALPVNGVSKRINNTPKERIANGNIHNSSSPLHCLSLLDVRVVSKHNNTNVVVLQVQRHPLDLRLE